MVPVMPTRTCLARGETPATHRDGRGAHRSRREEEEHRAYSTDEQRRAAGCIGRRMPWAFHHGLLVLIALLAHSVSADASSVGNQRGAAPRVVVDRTAIIGDTDTVMVGSRPGRAARPSGVH